jgi:uncharacterized protein (DUF2141 family)
MQKQHLKPQKTCGMNYFLLLFSCCTVLNTGNIVIEVHNCSNNKGFIMLALYNNATDFMKENKFVLTKKVKVQNQKAIIYLENLAHGSYAFALYQDANNNGKLDKNVFGIPKEGFAFSNNAMGTFGVPSFQQSSFVLKSANYQTTIQLKHY